MRGLQLLGFCFLALAVSAQEWTRFRGPNGTGISKAKTIPTEISNSHLRWKTELPGMGHSSPVLWGEKIFLTTTGDSAGGISVLCLDANDGRILWRKDFSLTPFPRHKFNSYASSTPAVDEGRVYVVWNEVQHYMVAALDHGGRVLWQRDLGPFLSQHGCGISPVVYNGKVFVGNEQGDANSVPANKDAISFLAAVDAKDGKVVWQTPRKMLSSAYSTPVVYEPKNGKPALIFNSEAHGISAIDPDSGKVVWEFSKAFDKRSVSSPVIAGDLIYGSCGSGGGGNFVTAVRAGDPATGRAPELAFNMKKSANYVVTPVVYGDLAWLWSDGGILTCVDSETGDIKYQERVGGNFFGSPVWIDGRLFAVSTSGELVVVPATDQFKVLHRYNLGELCHTTPAVAREQLFIRTEKHLWCFGGAKSASRL
jgi:outer membrane protein assembly factor BamB